MDPVISHHNNHYGGLFPIWVVVEYLSFNSISKFYGNLLENDKKIIAKNMFDVNESYLESWLHSLSVMRNICAHFGYVYRRKFSVRPRLYSDFGWNPNKNSEFFAISLVIGKLSNYFRKLDFCNKLEESKLTTNTFHCMIMVTLKTG